ncbi:MAG: hypothetical protein WAM58_00535 [Candidatus Acidiferrum sp.]
MKKRRLGRRTPNEEVLRILSDRGVANGLASVCAEGGGGIAFLPASWGGDFWGDAGCTGLRGAGELDGAFVRGGTAVRGGTGGAEVSDGGSAG